MRTTVYTDPTDPGETDEFPDCGASTTDEGELWIELWIVAADDGIESAYAQGEWSSFEVTA